MFQKEGIRRLKDRRTKKKWEFSRRFSRSLKKEKDLIKYLEMLKNKRKETGK